MLPVKVLAFNEQMWETYGRYSSTCVLDSGTKSQSWVLFTRIAWEDRRNLTLLKI